MDMVATLEFLIPDIEMKIYLIKDLGYTGGLRRFGVANEEEECRGISSIQFYATYFKRQLYRQQIYYLFDL
jgi:hypothetical protein